MAAPDLFVPKAESICLFLDVDGTLIDLAPTPDAVIVSSALLDELSLAEKRLDGALALVSGRPIDELDRLFTPVRLRASGIHGAEIRYSPSEPTRSLTNDRLSESAWIDLQHLLESFPGVFAENKGVSFAVHYNFAASVEGELFLALRRFVERFARFELELVPGNLVFEVKLPGFDKGSAIRRFMARAPFAGRRPVFIADDKMDRPGFETVLALGGIAFSVGFEMAGLSGSFSQPAGVRAWLGKVTA
ncbi:trehalose-phosphatase [Methylocapsa sp. S129]|uniref:trehalose-phosphatase n=1 Tax=Methylocapsa sp. S129 TaxID=1641869 RepID=UPI00131DBB78|nr:trehalose-phosphatase [Methylocapsa sp. S129]